MAIIWELKVTEMWREKFQGQTASEEIWSIWMLERCIGICLWGLWDRAIQGQSEPGGQWYQSPVAHLESFTRAQGNSTVAQGHQSGRTETRFGNKGQVYTLHNYPWVAHRSPKALSWSIPLSLDLVIHPMALEGPSQLTRRSDSIIVSSGPDSHFQARVDNTESQFLIGKTETSMSISWDCGNEMKWNEIFEGSPKVFKKVHWKLDQRSAPSIMEIRSSMLGTTETWVQIPVHPMAALPDTNHFTLWASASSGN